jgi:FkbM family methyltransferase
MQNLLKPEYLWRPSQVLRRLSFKPSNTVSSLTLPWDCTIRACSAEVIGESIGTQGVYDLPLTEAILRLTDAGDTGLDVGANIGYMSLVLARSAGPRGRVLCFEPNVDVIPTLRKNLSDWAALNIAPIEVNTVALSERDGEGSLGFPTDYERNQGVASLEIGNRGAPVRVCRLDSILSDGAGVMKVDVEGHEAAVFAGARNLLAANRIRDILFEEHQSYPAPSHKILLGHGYHLFRVTRSAWRPLLLSPEAPPRQAYLPSNFLATTNPARALVRFRPWGWYALSSGLRPA